MEDLGEYDVICGWSLSDLKIYDLRILRFARFEHSTESSNLILKLEKSDLISHRILKFPGSRIESQLEP